MLECVFCKRIPEEGDIKNASSEIKKFVKEHGYKYFKCNCEYEWIEVDGESELFDLNLFNKNIKTFNDFNNLITEFDEDLEYYHVVPHIKDCVSRINNWLTTGGNIHDAYVRNLLNNLKLINF